MKDYQTLNKLGDVISELTAIYRDISAELPKLSLVDTSNVPTGLKKMAVS